MPALVADLQISQRCLGPPTSPIKAIRIPELPSATFIVYGTGANLVAVQQILSSSSSAVQAQPLVLEIRKTDAHDASSLHSGEVNEVSQVATCCTDSQILIAACSGRDIAIFNIARYLDALRQGGVTSCTSNQETLSLFQHNAPVVALSWTNRGDGLLVAGKLGNVTMYQTVVKQEGSDSEFSVEQIWMGSFSTVTDAQDLISAGSHCWSPAASTQNGSKIATIWWPPSAPKPEADAPGGNDDSEAAKGKASGSAEYSKETLNIMNKIAPEKAPPGARLTGSTSNGAPELETVRDWTIAEQLKHPYPIVSLEWSPCNLQRGHHHTTEEEDSRLCVPESQPALLTVTEDGTLRVWVEVTLTGSASRNPFETTAPPAVLPGLPGGSHFCVTLVVQPPANLWSGGFLRAAWAVAERGHVASTGPQIRASKVLWITAVADSRDSQGVQQERLLVWAVDGLTGVLLGNSSGQGSRSARNPRALLWGQHAGQLSWAGVPTCRPQHVTTVSFDMDAPILHIFESYHAPDSGDGEFRMYRLDPVENEPLTPSGPSTPGVAYANAPRKLALHDFSAYNLLGHVGRRIVTLGVHDSGDLALSLDEAGCLLLWRTETLAPEFALPTEHGPWKAASWCPHPGKDLSASAAVVVAASEKSLYLFQMDEGKESLEATCLTSVTHLQNGLTPQSLFVSGSGGPGLCFMVSGSSEGKRPGFSRITAWQVGWDQQSKAELQAAGSAAIPSNVTAWTVISGKQSCILGGEDGQLSWVSTNPDSQLKVQPLTTVDGSIADLALAGEILAVVSNPSGIGRQSGSLHVFDVDTEARTVLHEKQLLLTDRVASACFLDGSYLVPALAVGLHSKGVILYVVQSSGQWGPLASLNSPTLTAPIVRASPDQPFLIASGNHLCSSSEFLTVEPAIESRRQRNTSSVPLAKYLLHVAGAKPYWEPQILKFLISNGRLKAAVEAIRALLGAHDESASQSGPLCHPTQFWDKELLAWAEQLAKQDPVDESPDNPGPASGVEEDTEPVEEASRADGPHRAPAQDPFAFSMAAFGMDDTPPASSAEPPPEPPKPSNPPSGDPFAFDMSAFGMDNGPPETAAETPPEPPKAAKPDSSDPFAFDMSAFGMDSPSATQQAEEPSKSTAADPYAFDASAFGMETEAPPKISQPADPFAFDVSAFGSEYQQPSHQDPPGLSTSQKATAIVESKGTPSPKTGSEPEKRQSDVDSSGSTARKPTALQRPAPAVPKAQGSSFTPQMPPKEAFQPLSTSELQRVKAICSQLADKVEEPEADHRNEPASLPETADTALLLDHPSVDIIGLAEALSEGGPEKIASAVALDAPAVHAAAQIQLAVFERGQRVEEPPSTSGRPFGPPPAAQPTGPAWAAHRLGLMKGLSARAAGWAAMSNSTAALLDLAAAMVTDEVEQDIKNEPRWEYSSTGQKTLDLGFGAGAQAPARGALTWVKMRAIGAGLWMEDRQMARQQAESLAKARYAETKDPSTCALFYAALGKKALLQGLYRTAMQKKQAEFLARDFSQVKHQEAACKNAFVLLGQHRYEMAAAFFLLGRRFRDAIGVCTHEMNDPQLALFLCQILEPNIGSQQEALILDELVSDAMTAGDLDSASVLLMRSGKHQQAVKILLGGDTSCVSPNELWTYDRIGLLRFQTALREKTSSEVLRHKAGLKKLAQHWASTLAACGAAGFGLEASVLGDVVGRRIENLENRVGRDLERRVVLAELSSQSLGHAVAQTQLSDDLLALYQGLGCKIEEDAVRTLFISAAKKLSPKTQSLQVDDSQPTSAELLRDSARSLQSHRPNHPHINNNILTEGYELLDTEGEKLFDVCVCNSDPGDWGNPAVEWRPLMVASGRHGLIEGEVAPQKGLPDDLISSATSESSYRGTTFTAMLSEMLDAVRWSADPWAPTGSSLGAAASRHAVALSNSPSHRANHVATAALAAHPFRPLFLSGSATGEICLWQFGKKGAIAGYSPLLAANSTTSASPSSSLFSSSPQSWNAMPGVNISHWGQPQSVTFSECGERFAAVGEGGVVACWRIDAPKLVTTDTGALGRADWCRQGLSKRGVDVTYVGGSSSVVAVAGFSHGGQNLAVWDTLAAPSAGPIASLAHHPSMVTSLQAVPGRRMLISADESGLVAAVDLRMLGGDKARRAVLWQSRNPTGGITCMTSATHPSSDMQLSISGDRSGAVGVWAAAHGQLLQSLPALPSASHRNSSGRRSFLDSLRKKSSTGSAVTGVSVCPEGAVACTLNGVVTLLPFVQ